MTDDVAFTLFTAAAAAASAQSPLRQLIGKGAQGVRTVACKCQLAEDAHNRKICFLSQSILPSIGVQQLLQPAEALSRFSFPFLIPFSKQMQMTTTEAPAILAGKSRTARASPRCPMTMAGDQFDLPPQPAPL